MTIRVGTIQEVKGEGFEILVDEATRSMVLARFLDGKLICSESEESNTFNPLSLGLTQKTQEPTLVA